MTKLIGDFLLAAATANTAVLFYAGHGVQIDGQNYLLPVDVSFTGASDFLTGAGPAYQYAGIEVQQMLTRVRAEVVASTKGKQVPVERVAAG